MNDQENSKVEKSTEITSTTHGEGKPAPLQVHAKYVELFEDSLAKEGEKALSRWGLGLFHNLSDEQVVAQRQALGFKPVDTIDFYNQGCAMAAQGKLDKAAESFRKAIELNKDFAEAHYNLALALEMAGDKPASRRTWQTYLERFASEDESAEIKQRLIALAE